MNQVEVGRLLHHVAVRQHAAAIAGRFYAAALVLAAVYLAVLMASRLLGVIPDVFELRTLLAIPVGAVLVAVLATRRGSAAAAARQVDTRMDTKDLFLTTALIDTSPGEYQDLVLRDAREMAREIRPSTVVPFDPWSRALNVVVVLLVLVAAVMLKFQLDPFGTEKARQVAAERVERLEKARQATATRAKTLQKKDLTAPNSDRVLAAMEDLKRDLKLMKPKDRAGNLRKLSEQKKGINKMWKDLSEAKLSDALRSRPSDQRFGSMETAKTRQWKQQLASGNTAGISKELSELKQMADQLSEMSDGKAKEDLQKEMDKRLGDLSDFASESGSSQPLSDALSRAMQQLDAASMEGLSQEAMEGLGETLDLAMLEMAAMGQSIRDLQSLSKALEALRLAQALNSAEGLDGEATEGLGDMASYAELYAQLMAGQGGMGGQGQGQGDGQGPGQGQGGRGGGMGNKGQGRGGKAPEDSSLQTAHKTEKESAALRAGKILMQWKTNELAQKGEIERDFATTVDQIRHDASEAIVQEEVPPGLHDTIKRYFDKIDQTIDKSEGK